MDIPLSANHVELVVPQEDFAGDRFWAAVRRLTGRLGHGGHHCCLIGETDRTERYRLCCTPCNEVLAVMLVERSSA